MMTVYGAEDSGEGTRVRDFHQDIKGDMPAEDGVSRRYHALDPDTYFWAHATFVEQVLYFADTRFPIERANGIDHFLGTAASVFVEVESEPRAKVRHALNRRHRCLTSMDLAWACRPSARASVVTVLPIV